MSHLAPCPGCQRHVRTHEQACPFCAAELDLQTLPAPVLPRARLGRAAIFAFGATLAASLGTTSCGGDTEDESRTGSGGAATGGGGTGGVDAGFGGALYGLPPPDSGFDAEATGGSAGSGGSAGQATGGTAGSGGTAGAAGGGGWAGGLLYGSPPP